MPAQLISLAILIVFVAFVYFEIRLSRAENKLPGLILPAITFISSFILTFRLAKSPGISWKPTAGMIIFHIFLFNLVTLFLLILYLIVRSLRQR